MWLILSLLSLVASQSNYYNAVNITFKASSISAILQYQGTPSSSIISSLNLTIISETYTRLRIRITDLNSPRWEVPDIIIPVQAPVPFISANYSVSIHNSPFGLEVTRNSNGQQIFNIDPTSLFQYQNQDIIMTSSLNYSYNIYGFGERVTNFPLNPGIYTLFSRDAAGPYDNGQAPGKNMYSSQPMYLGLDNLGNAHGGFLLNSDAMDISVTSSNITYRTIGGVIDYFVFVGPTPESVVKQYQTLVGFPVLTPYWGLGYHQSRWGYNNLLALENIVDKFLQYKIPLDVLWTDIDCMINYEDFTLDPTRYNYNDFAAFLDRLHAAGRRFVPITDAAIAKTNYPPYNDGTTKNLWIGSPNHPGALLGDVWPGPAVYIDWFNPNATQYWHDQMGQFRKIMEFDGFWVDMNEPSNFCDGECGYPPSPLVQNLPYTPGQTMLDTKTIDLAGTHYGGLLEYDVHNMYGFKMAIASATFFTQVLNTRPFVISRSSFPSHGRHASKWLGDNFSQFEWMAYSIPGMFNFQIFGIPLMGADICGFNWDTTEELCCRWYQLGMMYTFSRNHNSNSSISQEPWAFGPTLLSVSNNAIRAKYSLMNYYYTLMFHVSNSGGTVFKPTFFEFPNDFRLQRIHSQDNFMVGGALLVHPVLTQGAITVDAYFPADVWYNWYSGKQIVLPFNRTLTLLAPLDGMINVHMRGGHIIPRNDGFETALTSQQLRYSNITLVIAVSGQGKAVGMMVLDDGLSVDTISSGNYTAMEYVYIEGSTSAQLNFNIIKKGYTKARGEWPFISQIVIYGCLQPITSIFNQNQRVDYNLQYSTNLKVAVGKIDHIFPDEAYNLTINF